MDEQVSAGMERNIVTEDGITFDNQYITVDEEAVRKEVEATEAETRRQLEEYNKQMQAMRPKLKRTPDGLQQAEDGMVLDSLFDIIEVGDNINHQQVVKKEDGKLVLDYFGKESELTNENEIFSVLIREELDTWINQLKGANLSLMFEDTDPNMLIMFRALELLCININMEEVTHLTAPDRAIDQRMLAMLIGTLRKPAAGEKLDDNTKIVAIALDYCNICDMDDEHILYRVALTNHGNVEVKEGDRIILC